MSDSQDRIEQYLDAGAQLATGDAHSDHTRAFHVGGKPTVFVGAEGAHLTDDQGEQYLDLIGGGGVYFIGRNHPAVMNACRDVLEMDLPNLSIVNASVLGGLVAERLLSLTEGHMQKVIYANSGTEATDVMIRFARFVTRKRRFLYLDGGFHGRSFGAISVCGFPALQAGQAPLMPTTTAIPPNDLRRLRRELKKGDVAGFLFEPVQALTGTVLDRGYLREAEVLCRQAGALLLADEVQTGLGRTGHWFNTIGRGVRPDMMSISGALSGGTVPVAAVTLTNDVYDNVYAKLTSGPIYFSTFAENNMAMTAALTTLDVLEELDAPALAQERAAALRTRLDALCQAHDAVASVGGDGLLVVITFAPTDAPHVLEAAALVGAGPEDALSAALTVALYRDHRVMVQRSAPGQNAVTVLPPVTATDADLTWFLDAFEATLVALTTAVPATA